MSEIDDAIRCSGSNHDALVDAYNAAIARAEKAEEVLKNEQASFNDTYRMLEKAEAQCARMREALECIKINAEIDGHGPLIELAASALADDSGSAMLAVVQAAKNETEAENALQEPGSEECVYNAREARRAAVERLEGVS